MSAATALPIRVLLVDDHALVRTGLRMMIESDSGLVVIGEVATREEALAAAAREQVDIILLDLDLGGESSLDFLPELIQTSNGARVLVLTGVLDPDMHHKAVRLGAMGLVHKVEVAKVLLTAIKKVHAGEVWLRRTMVANVLNELSQPPEPAPADPEAPKIARLTDREQEVIALIGEGLRNKQIAERLFISEPTVRHHLGAIFDKLEVMDRLELIIYAYKHGLATLPSAANSRRKPAK